MKTILCYGDSNTWGYDPVSKGRFPYPVRWPGRLQRLLGDGYRVIEEGMSGRTTRLNDPHYEPADLNGETYLRPCIETHNPIDLVVLMLGTNDMKEWFPVSAQEIADNAGRLVEIIKTHPYPCGFPAPEVLLVRPAVVLDTILTCSDMADQFGAHSLAVSRETAEPFRRVAREKGCLYFDANDAVSVSPADSIHFSKEDHEAFARAIADIIGKQLEA